MHLIAFILSLSMNIGHRPVSAPRACDDLPCSIKRYICVAKETSRGPIIVLDKDIMAFDNATAVNLMRLKVLDHQPPLPIVICRRNLQ